MEILQVAQFFPRIVEEDENEDLMAEISENDLRRSFTPSKRIKVWGLMDGLLNFSWAFMI